MGISAISFVLEFKVSEKKTYKLINLPIYKFLKLKLTFAGKCYNIITFFYLHTIEFSYKIFFS